MVGLRRKQNTGEYGVRRLRRRGFTDGRIENDRFKLPDEATVFNGFEDDHRSRFFFGLVIRFFSNQLRFFRYPVQYRTKPAIRNRRPRTDQRLPTGRNQSQMRRRSHQSIAALQRRDNGRLLPRRTVYGYVYDARRRYRRRNSAGLRKRLLDRARRADVLLRQKLPSADRRS